MRRNHTDRVDKTIKRQVIKLGMLHSNFYVFINPYVIYLLYASVQILLMLVLPVDLWKSINTRAKGL